MVPMAAGKLIVEVVAARDLMLKQGRYSTDVFCVLDFDGQQKETRVKREGLNPTWNEKFEFVKHDIRNDIETPRDLEISIFHQIGIWCRIFSARVVIPSNAVPERPADVRWYPLQGRNVFPLNEGDLGLRIWLQTAEPNAQDGQPDFLRPSVATETSTESLPTNFQRQLFMEENETDVNRGYESNGSIGVPSAPQEFSTFLERIRNGEGSSSANLYLNEPVLSYSSYNPHPLDEQTTATNTLESIESEIENLLNERMVARVAHLEKMEDLENANHSRVAEAFEYASHTEWSIQETSPLCGSQLVAQSLQRTQSMLASKQTLENFHIPLNLIPRIEDAMENERQLLKSVTKTARDAGEQQKQLSDMEQNAYQAYLALIEKQNKEQMETFQQEKEQRLNLWAVSRRHTLDAVQSIENNSQLLVERLNTLVETTRKHRKKWEADMLRELGGEATEETSTSSKSECQICFDYVEGPSSGTSRTRDLKQRSCLIPCNHAMICLPCATEIWESTKSCPFCKVKLTTKPCELYLG